MLFRSLAVLFGLALLTPSAFAESKNPAEPPDPKPGPPAEVVAEEEPKSEPIEIQLAILLDTSGSMDGLINQARTQLWKIVNELAAAEQQGKETTLHVALYEYGKSSIPESENYLRQIVPLTDDLDKISEELFALTTNGGSEYCGAVIKAATEGLKWSKSDDALKLIYVCGNEGFHQGSVDAKAACKTAIEQGIVVNTIFCGNEQEGVNTGWKEGATLADGSFLSIDQNRAVAAIKTPFDAELAKLSGQVNSTYVFFGVEKQRKLAAERQTAQDANAAGAAPAAAATRAAFKASGKYNVAQKDLVTEVTKNKAKLGDIKDEELPDSFRKLSPEERQKKVAELAKERETISKKIQELTKKRNEYVAAERKKQAEEAGEQSLDEAIIDSLREQAEKKSFKFNN